MSLTYSITIPLPLQLPALIWQPRMQLPTLQEQLGELLSTPSTPSNAPLPGGRDPLLTYLDPPQLQAMSPDASTSGQAASDNRLTVKTEEPEALPSSTFTLHRGRTQSDSPISGTVSQSRSGPSSASAAPQSPDDWDGDESDGSSQGFSEEGGSGGGQLNPNRKVPWEACRCVGIHTKHLRHWETACFYNPNRKRFLCGLDKCRKSFARADGRKRHWDKFHDGRRPTEEAN